MSVLCKEDEQRLIARAVDGHREACGELIRSYQGSLYAYMLKMSGRPDVAEDITQEAFVRVLSNLHRFDPQYRFSTWLFTIARRLYLNACQKHKPAYDTDTIGGLASDRRLPSDGLERDEERDRDRSAIDRAMNALSEDQRQILLLFHQQDWSIAVIAQHMQMPEGTIKSHLHRGRRRLRVFLEQEERYQRETEHIEREHQAAEAAVPVVTDAGRGVPPRSRASIPGRRASGRAGGKGGSR